MFTWASKYLFSLAGVSLLSAAAYGLISGGGAIGVISAGYKGGVGDHVGYTVLVALGIVTLFLGVLSVIIRDGDAETATELVGTEGALSLGTPRKPSFWAPLAAFGVACLAVGLAVSPIFAILGVVILAVVLLQWTVLAWSERATGDDEVNATIRNRTIGPLEVPMLSVVTVLMMVLVATVAVVLLVLRLRLVVLAVLVLAVRADMFLYPAPGRDVEGNGTKITPRPVVANRRDKFC